MSTVGLNAGLYLKIRRYAEMLDDVLIQLKSGSATPNDPRVQSLAALLQKLGGPAPRDAESLLLLAVLQTADAPPPAQAWEQLGRELLSATPTPVLIAQLERLATTIEHERAGMLAAMRGA